MSVYFFDLNGRRHGEGLSLTDDAAAWEEAAGTTLEIMRGLQQFPKPGEEWTLKVSDTAGQVLTIRISTQSYRARR